MKPELHFDMVVDKVKCTLSIIREFAANRQLVWDCHTKPELLDRWFAPKPLIAKTKSMDFRDGGHWHYSMTEPSGMAYWSRFEFDGVRPIDGYLATAGFTDETGKMNLELPLAKWNITFTARNDHTIVKNNVTYESAEALQQILDMGMKDGMTSVMERLDELLLELN